MNKSCFGKKISKDNISTGLSDKLFFTGITITTGSNPRRCRILSS